MTEMAEMTEARLAEIARRFTITHAKIREYHETLLGEEADDGD